MANIKLLLWFLIFFSNCNSRSKTAELKKTSDSALNENKISNEVIVKHIDNYTVFIREVKNNSDLLCLRKFTDADTKKEYFLVVNVNTLKTSLFPADKIEISDSNSVKKNMKAAYFRLQNFIINKKFLCAGIDSSANSGYCLTMDLCPSTKKFDNDFFDLITAKKISPYYLCVSGMWIEKHQSELKYILQHNKENDITWVNHSYRHYYDPKKPLNKNFMLSDNTDFDKEVLYNEQVMLENGIVPSPFFRFPGLICDARLCEKIISYGLIPLSSNAWLAKGQKPKNGSIILLHLNGNERSGLDLFRKFNENTRLNPTSVL